MRVDSKWLTALLLLGVMFLSGCSLPFVQKLKARDSLNDGVAEFTNQRYATAVEFFKKSLELDPGFETARMYLATAYMNQYRRGVPDPANMRVANTAIDTFKEVVANAEAAGRYDMNAMLSIANLYYLMDNHADSKEWCDKILAIDPDNAEVYYRVAVMDYEAISAKTGDASAVTTMPEDELTELKRRVDQGLDYIGRALKFRNGYYEAMEYQNLLWREKAKMETDEDVKAKLILQASDVYYEAVQLGNKAREEAAKKPKTATRK